MARTLVLLSAVATVWTGAAVAQHAEHRELGAHVHGTATLNVAVEGDAVSMELDAPGADIVGFEHEAESEADRAAVAKATATLKDPLALFAVPAAAGCTLASAEVSLVEEEGEHAEGEAAHEGGAHAAAEHARESGEHAHHAAFEAAYALTCTNPAALTGLDMPYFTAFPNAREVAVNLVDEAGARAFTVRRDSPAVRFGGAS